MLLEKNIENYFSKENYKNELEKAMSISVIKASEELCSSYEKHEFSNVIKIKLETGTDCQQKSIISG